MLFKRKKTMKKLIVSFLFVLGFVSCSNEVPEPDTPEEVVSDTSRLFSIYGPELSIEFDYDDMGRPFRSKQFFGSTLYRSEYKYDKDHIYVSTQRYAWDSNHTEYSHEVAQEDTLFLVDSRVDSCAGIFQTANRIRDKKKPQLHYLKFRYNERGEMIYCCERTADPEHVFKPGVTELTYEWKDGNIVKTTSTAGFTSYSYTSLPGHNSCEDQRCVRYEYDALVENGYFGVACKNLLESYETNNGSRYLFDYELDDQQRVRTIKRILPYEDRLIVQSVYNLTWEDTVRK